MKIAKGKHQLKLTSLNESASKKKRPFEYNEAEKPDSPKKSKLPFALKDLDPDQMREINQVLQEYIEVPRPFSLPRRVLVPSPDMRPEALNDENLSEAQRQELYRIQMEYHETGKKPETHYTYDLHQIQERS